MQTAYLTIGNPPTHFIRVQQDGLSLTKQAGQVGKKGRTTTKRAVSVEEATKIAKRWLHSAAKKGYQWTALDGYIEPALTTSPQTFNALVDTLVSTEGSCFKQLLSSPYFLHSSSSSSVTNQPLFYAPQSLPSPPSPPSLLRIPSPRQRSPSLQLYGAPPARQSASIRRRRTSKHSKLNQQSRSRSMSPASKGRSGTTTMKAYLRHKREEQRKVVENRTFAPDMMTTLSRAGSSRRRRVSTTSMQYSAGTNNKDHSNEGRRVYSSPLQYQRRPSSRRPSLTSASPFPTEVTSLLPVSQSQNPVFYQYSPTLPYYPASH